ncbi:MAG: hypothetical protein ABIH86_02095 [Planctomycetota bacterium]
MPRMSWLSFSFRAGFKKPLEFLVIGSLLTASWNMLVRGTLYESPVITTAIAETIESRSLPNRADEIELSATAAALIVNGYNEIPAEQWSPSDKYIALDWGIRLICFFPFAALLIGAFRYLDSLARNDELAIGIILSGFSPILESALAVTLFSMITILPGYLIFQVAQTLHQSVSWVVAIPFYSAAIFAFIALTASHIYFFVYLSDGRLKPMRALHAARRRALKQPLQAIAIAMVSTAVLIAGNALWTIGLFVAFPLAIAAVSAAANSRKDETLPALGGAASTTDPTDWRAATQYRQTNPE